MICLLLSTTVKASAPNRVLYDFDQMTDNSGKITLFWKAESNKRIQVISYYMNDDNVMEVTYRVGDQIPEGYHKMTIMNPSITFPVPIILKEQKVEGDPLSDLPQNKEERYDILTLYDQGIINGYVDGTFKPNNTVIRAEFFAILVGAVGYEVVEQATSIFTDVADDYWAKKFIMALADRGIVKGNGDGLCNPIGDVTIGQVLALIDRTFILYEDTKTYSEPTGSHWSNPSYVTLAKAGIVRSTDAFSHPYKPDMKATRKQCASLISRVLQSGYSIR